jgi:hypothetical protein
VWAGEDPAGVENADTVERKGSCHVGPTLARAAMRIGLMLPLAADETGRFG